MKAVDVGDLRHWFVFAGGGTGGHLFPALGVVEWMRERDLPIDVSFFCTGRSIDQEVLGQTHVEARPLTVQPLPTRPWRWPRFLWRWRQSVSACRKAFRQRRPAVIVGAGGYASGPPVHVGLQQGIPTFLLNPDAVPGRANRHLGRRKELAGVFAQWAVTREWFPASTRVFVTGCPVRRAFRLAGTSQGTAGEGEAAHKRAEAKKSFGLDATRPTLMVTGASQGARTINEAIVHLVGLIAGADWQILHLTGHADHLPVKEAHAKAGVAGAVMAFTDRMAEAMLAADLIISRAGASTLAEILVLGKPSILLPYPWHRDRHQWHNAEVLAKAGAAIVLEDLKDGWANARQLEKALPDLLNSASQRERMAAAARELGKPQAAAEIAERLCQAADLRY